MYRRNESKEVFQEIIKQTSLELNLPQHIISEVVESQFEFTRNVIKKGNSDTVKLIYIGRLLCYPIVKYIKDLKETQSYTTEKFVYLKWLLKRNISAKKQEGILSNLDLHLLSIEKRRETIKNKTNDNI